MTQIQKLDIEGANRYELTNLHITNLARAIFFTILRNIT
jgi:hypothetical protein